MPYTIFIAAAIDYGVVYSICERLSTEYIIQTKKAFGQ